MKKCSLRKIDLVLLTVLVTLVMMPSVSFAAGDVFDTIQAKMISTVKDIRKIAYVIAGFGLVMFSFLAIFNKISFKHLGYIMISLSLLALMMPFINYFSGASIQDNELNYDDFIGAGDASIQGSNVEAKNDCATTNTCPEDREPLEPLPEIDSSGMTAEAEIMTETGLAMPEVELTPEEQKKTFKEKMQDLINTGKKVADGVHNTIDAAADVKHAVDVAVAGAQAVKEIAQSDASFIDKIGGISTAVGSTAVGVAAGVGGAMNEAGDVTGALGMEGVSDALNNIGNAAHNVSGEINDYTGMGQDVSTILNSLEHAGTRVSGN